MMIRSRILSVLLGCLFGAVGWHCSSSALNSNSNSDSSSGSGSSSSTTEITLASCTTSVASAAPDFFKNYFKCVTVTDGSTTSTVRTDDLPPHRSYYYGSSHPNYEDFDYSRGGEYAPNPNAIAEQDITIVIPDNPTAKGLTITDALVDGTVGTSDEEYPLGPAGVALDGVAIFNPLAAPGDDIAEERFVFDSYDAHPTENDTYHYHTASPGPLEVLAALGLTTSTTPGSATIELYGIMCDGTVILGCTELNGATPASSDFDAQNGHVHDLTDDDGEVIFSSRYHTHLCPTLYTSHLYTPEIQYYEDCTVE